MGKQWLLYKVAGDGGSDGFHATGKSPSTTNNSNSAGKSRKRSGQRHTSSLSSSSSSSGGCMSAIFHLFNIQHHHFPFHQPSLIPETPINFPQEPTTIIHKGVEAPRNSLDLEEQEPMVEEVASSSSSSSKIKQETNFNIPMGGIQIKTKRSRLLMEDVSSSEEYCSSSSPGTKTPNLVARLMGLDLLPQNSSPRPSLSSPRPSSSSSTPLVNPLPKFYSHKNYNTRSLPSTPRISTAATEVLDYNHRLSLQINNKENCKRTYDESTSEYAKHIAKQVRENISRRVGADITNYTINKKEQRRDELLVVLKPSPPSSATLIDKSRNLDQGHLRGKENEITPLSCSPRQTLSEIKNNLYKPNSDSSKSSSSLSSTKVMKAPTTKSPPLMKQGNPCKRIASEKYDLRLKKMNQQEDVFVKKCNVKKSTPLSNHLVNVNIVNNTTKFISFKKDMASPTSSTTILSQKQVPLASITQLPSCQNRSYNTNYLSVKDDVSTNGNDVAASTTTTTTGSSVSEYISRILSHSGIEKSTPISITQWYSPSHPLHPSIFDQLEKIFYTTTTATTFADRKLIFEVVDELLVEILKPYLCLKPWAYSSSRRNSHHRMYGWELTEKLSQKIRCFPAADCHSEDIDGLIAGDMRSRSSTPAVAFEEEAEEVVAEIESDMVDTLVGEVALAGIIWHVGCGNRV